MTEEQHSTPIEVRITGINTDKTRKADGSESLYAVYLVLSTAPPQPWRDLFMQEWKKLNSREPGLWQEVSIDREFLVLNCRLEEVEAVRLPALKEVVAATNTSYGQYLREQDTEKTRREHVWTDERDNVEHMAKSLRFDKQDR